MTDKKILGDTGERMVPEFHTQTLIYAEHLIRYQAATDLVKNKIVLDIASGSGYGTQLLANTAKYVYGVDVNINAVGYARKNYNGDNIEFIEGDGEKIPLADNSVDVVITFETIEHIKDYKQFLREVKRVLKNDGIAIVSTPNDAEFAEGNHFHLHEFEQKELQNLLSEYFKHQKSYFQATWKYVMLGTDTFMKEEQEIKIPTLNLAPIRANQYLYFYNICSDRDIIEEVSPIAALGEHYSDRLLLGEHVKKQTQIENLQGNVNRLESESKKQITNAREETRAIQYKLNQVTSSRSYKLARKLANAKQKVSKLYPKK